MKGNKTTPADGLPETGCGTTGLKRRTVLGWLFLSAGLLAAQLAGAGRAFLTPPQKRNRYGGIIDVGLLDDIPLPGAVPKLNPAGRFWLVHDESGLFALRHACTHLECLFHWDEGSRLFVCPCHGSQFSPDGRVLRGPADRPLDRFPIQLVGADGQPVRATDHVSGAAVPVADLLRIAAATDAAAPTEGKTGGAFRLQVDTGTRIVMAREG